jgi:hypothetical protein
MYFFSLDTTWMGVGLCMQPLDPLLGMRRHRKLSFANGLRCLAYEGLFYVILIV